MFNSKMYATLALALPFIGAAPAQAGWNAWNAPPLTETARQQPTVAPEPGYEAFAAARKRVRTVRARRSPSATIGTPAPSRPSMTGHTLHHPGH
jgi:hypothetical protein